MKFLLLTCLFSVFYRVSGQRSLQYSLLGKFYVQSQPSTTIYSCSRSKICCAVACTGNDLCAFFSRDDDICMLYDQSWTANLTTFYNSSWSTYKAANSLETAVVSTQTPGCVIDQTTNGSSWMPDSFTFQIAGGFVDDKKIELKGTPSANPRRFNINLQNNPTNDENITFHFDVRFDYLGYKNIIVFYNRVNGVWKLIEQLTSRFPFLPSKPYVITITRDNNTYYMDVYGELLHKFTQRPGDVTPDWLVVRNDTTVTCCNVV